MTNYIPSHLLKKSVIARPIKRVQKPVERRPRKEVLQNLRNISEGRRIHPKLVKTYLGRGYVSVKYVPELTLTAKAKKLIGE